MASFPDYLAKILTRAFAILATISMVVASGSAAMGASDLPLKSVKLPPGFQIQLFARVPGARSMARGAKGTIFVGTADSPGKVYAVVDKDNDYRADQVYTIADGLYMPNGVAFKEEALFVAAVNRILRFDKIETRLSDPPPPAVVYDKLPSDRHHGWKYIAFGPDGWLYVPIAAPCNVCERSDERYASMCRIRPDGSDFQIYARGIRNTVGFDWHPLTKELWFTDNGRDWLGDDRPPDELNVAGRRGLHFGFPYCHGRDIADPDFGHKHKCSEFTAPALELGPHVAALAARFYTGKMFPSQYHHQIFIAEHGSWNRSQPIGYRITLARKQEDGSLSYETFAQGWLQGSRRWGRPVDILQLPDGSLLVSDDHAGAIYRITYRTDAKK